MYQDYLPQEAINKLENHLSSKRFQHSVGVCQTAFLLAQKWKDYPVDPVKLAWAALFHDCAKELNYHEIGHLVKLGLSPYGLELMTSKKLCHAPLGAAALKHWYNQKDEEVHLTVAYHPTGSPQLTPIGWMVYIADYLEPNRPFFQEREELLQQACEDPLTGLKMITNLRINTVVNKGRSVHPLGRKFKEYLDSLTVLEPKPRLSNEEIFR